MEDMQRIVALALTVAPDPKTRALVGEVETDGLVTRVCSIRIGPDVDSWNDVVGVTVTVEACAGLRSRVRLALLADNQEHKIGGWNHLGNCCCDGAMREVFFLVLHSAS